MSLRPYVPTFETEPAGERPTWRPTSVRPEASPPPRPPLIKLVKRARRKPYATATWHVVQAFAETLRLERERRQLGMTALAAHLDMGVSQYRKLENGYTAPTIRLANRMCRRLGITFALGESPE